MTIFTPCKGKTSCRDDGVTCHTCGRGLEEIETTRQLIDALAEHVLQHDYTNVAEFAAYLASKLEKKVAHRRGQE